VDNITIVVENHTGLLERGKYQKSVD